MQKQAKLDGYKYYSLPELLGNNSRLPISIRIMLESLLRNCDGVKVTLEDIKRLANYDAKRPNPIDIPFCVSRVILQDFTGVPLLVDLAAMRESVDVAEKVEPLVPVDLIIDHSVQVDAYRSDKAFTSNLQLEFERNKERYEFLKWGQEAFKTFKVVPPGIGIVHQVNLEHLAKVVIEKDGLLYPDTLVGTDSHTTMINGLGVVGWGVGGIEAEAAMLGQPVCLKTPEVVGVHLSNSLSEAVTATDLALRVTELLREKKVVDKFVEFFGEGAASLTVADRATIANMAPEYGATMGFFPVDEKTLEYLRLTGRDESHVQLIEKYLKAQDLFGIPRIGEIDYSCVLELDLASLKPCVAGPKRPQDRIALSDLKTKFQELLSAKVSEGGYEKTAKDLSQKAFVHPNGFSCQKIPLDAGGTMSPGEAKAIWSEQEMVTNRPLTKPSIESEAPPITEGQLTHGSIVIAAITSCTNTSNPFVMMAAGLLAKKAFEKGLRVSSLIKTSLAPGSRVVTDYLEKAGLQPYLDALGFQLVAYGCTTCIGNSGPLDPKIEKPIQELDLIAASVLSGNRNFEARIHSSVKANFLMSPPLVIAFAIAGRIDIDLTKEPLANGVYLKDIWPSSTEIEREISKVMNPSLFKKRYAHILDDNPMWKTIPAQKTARYRWDPKSTYIRKPHFFEETPPSSLTNMRSLLLLGDSVTTDHISPAGAISATSAAGKYLLAQGVKEEDFNSYGSRRGNHEVMMRGTFANPRLSNKLAKGKEGAFTTFLPTGEILPIFEASQKYREANIPLIIFAGKDYGMGSSRDWAAKGTALLGVKAVVAESFERIHRSNLIGMGILPLQFHSGENLTTLHITAQESFTLHLDHPLKPKQEVLLEFGARKVKLISCLDTPMEIAYYENRGILPFVLNLLRNKKLS